MSLLKSVLGLLRKQKASPQVVDNSLAAYTADGSDAVHQACDGNPSLISNSAPNVETESVPDQEDDV